MNDNSDRKRKAERGRSFEAIKQDLSRSILATKSPTDFIITLIYCIPIIAPIRVCIEADIFRRLTQSERPLSAEELGAAFSPDDSGRSKDDDYEKRDFVVRMLRAASAIGLIDEPSAFTYAANELTGTIADPGLAAGFQLLFDNVMGPKSTMAEMVSYHKANNWKAPPSADDGPWQRARGVVGSSTFDNWVAHDPLQLTRLSSLMQRMQRARPHWTEWFPEYDLLGDTDANDRDTQVFVDVGGGRGHDLSALAKRYPDDPIIFILQDLPSVIQEGEIERKRLGQTLDPRIRFESHDFFEPQQISGVDIYYMHKIMHDWPDNDCVRILAHLRDNMKESSRIFINDVILPNQGCSLLHAAFDIDMLALHSGKERDEDMWNRLVDKVQGLKIKRFWPPPGGDGEGIIEIVKK